MLEIQIYYYYSQNSSGAVWTHACLMITRSSKICGCWWSQERTYHGVETGTKVMSCNKYMVASFASVPVWHHRGNQRYRWMNSPGCMAYWWKSSLGTEFTWHIHREEEEISFIWIQGSKGTAQQDSMNGYLCSKQVVAAPFVNKPILIELCRQVIHIDLHCSWQLQGIQVCTW